jgi:methyl-accepting chemotaxis protein
MKYSRTGFSKNFILTVSIIYASLIIVTALILNWALKSTVEGASEILLHDNIKGYSRIISLIADEADGIKDLTELKKHLSGKSSKIQGVTGINLYQRTDDESYFRVFDIIINNTAYVPEISPGQSVKPEQGLDIMKESLTRITTDSRVYTDGILRWQYVYAPLHTEKSLILSQWIVSVAETEGKISALKRNYRAQKIIIFLLSLIISAGVIGATWLFYQNYSYILRGIASHLDRAADGNYNIRISISDDEELNRIAGSFNALVEDIRDWKIRADDIAETMQEINSRSDELFRSGVAALKNSRQEDAISAFKAVTILRPESFSSYFNMGVAMAQLKKYDEAVQMFAMALEIKPEHEQSRSYMNKIEAILKKNTGNAE